MDDNRINISVNYQGQDNQDDPDYPENEEQELSLGDKLTGSVMSPAETFGSISRFELKLGDWLAPLSLLLVAAVLFTILKFADPEVAAKNWEEQRAKVVQQLKKEGKSADEIKDMESMMDKQKEMMSGGLGYVFMGVPIIVGGFIMFFISVAIYWGFAKLILHSPISYKGAMIAYSLPALLSIGGMIVSTILTLLFSTMYVDTSLSSFLQLDSGYLKSYFSAIDPIKIGGAYLTGIGMAKLSYSENTNSYIALSVGLLFGFYFLIGTLSLLFPEFAAFGM